MEPVLGGISKASEAPISQDDPITALACDIQRLVARKIEIQTALVSQKKPSPVLEVESDRLHGSPASNKKELQKEIKKVVKDIRKNLTQLKQLISQRKVNEAAVAAHTHGQLGRTLGRVGETVGPLVTRVARLTATSVQIASRYIPTFGSLDCGIFTSMREYASVAGSLGKIAYWKYKGAGKARMAEAWGDLAQSATAIALSSSRMHTGVEKKVFGVVALGAGVCHYWKLPSSLADVEAQQQKLVGSLVSGGNSPETMLSQLESFEETLNEEELRTHSWMRNVGLPLTIAGNIVQKVTESVLKQSEESSIKPPNAKREDVGEEHGKNIVLPLVLSSMASLLGSKSGHGPIDIITRITPERVEEAVSGVVQSSPGLVLKGASLGVKGAVVAGKVVASVARGTARIVSFVQSKVC